STPATSFSRAGRSSRRTSAASSRWKAMASGMGSSHRGVRANSTRRFYPAPRAAQSGRGEGEDERAVGEAVHLHQVLFPHLVERLFHMLHASAGKEAGEVPRAGHAAAAIG